MNKGFNVNDKNVLVIGLGVSGIASAERLKELGADVTIIDETETPELKRKAEDLREKGIEVFLSDQSVSHVDGIDLMVISPGVPIDNVLVKKAEQNGVEVISEVELASRLTTSPIIAVTGTNGKTTVVTLLGEMFKTAGLPHHVTGNIGTPFIESVRKAAPDDVLIVEISSFQMEKVRDFHPHVGIILNVTEDHLDRHLSMEAYLKMKSRMFINQTKDDYAVLNHDDPILSSLFNLTNTSVIGFSQKESLDTGVYIKDKKIMASIPPRVELQEVASVDDIKLRGYFNQENILAAVAAALIFGLPKEAISKAIRSFKGLPHRLEYITTINGVAFYDDSKATNPDAVVRALEAFDDPVILVAGGRNKGMDFNGMNEAVKDNVAEVILLGEASDSMAEGLKKVNMTNMVHKVKTMEEAVFTGFELSKQGQIVLLSPACASFDMFSSYRERGDVFQQAVHKIKKGQSLNR